MKINKFILFFLTSLSFVASFYFVRSTPSFYYSTYSTFVLLLTFLFFSFLNNSPIKYFLSFITFFKYLFAYYFFDILLQLFFHNINLGELIFYFANHLTSFMLLYVFSRIFYDNKSYFLQINHFIFSLLYLSLLFGVLDSINAINFNFLAPSKEIENYNFWIFSNTSGLMEHQISFGISMLILLSTALIIKKSNLLNLIAISIGVFISFSRTSYLLLALSIFAWLYLKNYLSKNLIFLIIFFLITIVFLVDFTNIEIFNNLLRLDKGLSGREVIFATYFLIPWSWSDILFGLGYGNLFSIRDAILTDFEFGVREFQFKAIHNLYLNVFANSGIILFITYFGSQLHLYYQHIKKKKEFFQQITIIALTFFIGNFFVEFKLGGIRIISFYFTLILAYMFSTHKINNEIK